MPSSFSLHIFDENNKSMSFPSFDQSLGSSRSHREPRMLVRFNDYVIEGKYKYGIERLVNYSFLNNDNICFMSKLNKTIKPKNYFEASLDLN